MAGAKNTTFETAVHKLEEIVAKLEQGDASLEESLKLFEQGSELAAFCYRKLETAQQRIREISQADEEDSDAQ